MAVPIKPDNAINAIPYFGW